MKKKKYRYYNKDANNLSEPAVPYSAKGDYSGERIIISTLTEQEESNYKYWLSLTPEQRLAEHYKLLQKIYGGVRDKDEGNRIVFDV